MSPLEILKKFRQFALHTNQLMKPGIRPPLPKPTAQFGGVSFAVPHGDDFDLLPKAIHDEEDRVRPALDFCFSSQPPGKTETLRLSSQGDNRFPNRRIKTQTQALPSRFVPINRFVPFPPCLRLDDDGHCFARSRCSISAKTSSAGIPRSGCLSASSARRSSSAICSGVSSGSYPCSEMSSQSSCASSMRSFNGRAIAAFRISVALMAGIYPGPTGRQGAFHSAFRAPRSAFP